MLVMAFAVILASFAMIMTGISISEPRLEEAALIFLAGALLYSPLKNRVFGEWMRKRKKEPDGIS